VTAKTATSTFARGAFVQRSTESTSLASEPRKVISWRLSRSPDQWDSTWPMVFRDRHEETDPANRWIRHFDMPAPMSGAPPVVADTYITPMQAAVGHVGSSLARHDIFVAMDRVWIPVAAPAPQWLASNELQTTALRYLSRAAGAWSFAVPSPATTLPRGALQHLDKDLLSWVLLKYFERQGRVHLLHYLGSPVLRQRSSPVAVVNEEVLQIVDDLFETMRANKGVGLAANQIGVAKRVAVVDVGEDDPPPLVLINPVILRRSKELETAEEGCLSIPQIFGDVERPMSLTFQALGRDGEPYVREVAGYKARAVQHEIDHLDGVLFLDHLSAMKRNLLLSKWRKSQRGKHSYLQDREPDPTSKL